MDKQIKKKHWTIRYAVPLTGLGVVIALSVFSITRPDRSVVSVDPNKITYDVVATHAFQEYIPVNGSVLPETTVFLDLEEGGIVEKVHIEGGNPVQQGDLILSFSNSMVQKQNIDSETRLLENLNFLRNSKISLTEKALVLKEQLLDLNYQIKEQEKKFQRYQTLFNDMTRQISEETFELCKDNLNYLKQKRILLRERIKQESQLSEQQNKIIDQSIAKVNKSLDVLAEIAQSLEVRAPIDGFLSSMNVEVGQSFQRGQRVGQIDKLEGFKVRADVDQYYIAKVEVDQIANYQQAGTAIQLRVTKIYPEVIDNTFFIDLAFNNASVNDIKRGQTLRLNLSLSQTRQTKVLPKGSFFRHTQGRWVYRIASDGATAEKVGIVSGKQNPRQFEILDGLELGDRIITSSYDKFKDSDTVKFTHSLNQNI